MKVGVELVESGRLPARATDGAAGWDCYARETIILFSPRIERPVLPVLVPLGFKLFLPPGCYGRICPRSGLTRDGIIVTVGTIDSDYRGEVCALMHNMRNNLHVINAGDRVAQLIVQRCEDVEWDVVESLPPTARGEGGFGSTGR